MNSKLFFYILIFFSPLRVYPELLSHRNGSGAEVLAQNKTTDSLQAIFNNAQHDTTKVTALIAITEELAVANPDTVISICNKAIEIIEKNLASAKGFVLQTFLKQQALLLSNIGDYYDHHGNISKALELQCEF